MDRKRKPLIIGTVAAVILLATFAVATVLIPVFQGPGVKTGELDPRNATAATTEIDGAWKVVYGDAPNISSVGFTFKELLPSDARTTSGSTRGIRGNATISDATLTSGRIEVDMTSLSTDTERRDINVRQKIFETDSYPSANFEVTENVDLSNIPDDATVAEVTVTGDLTIKGKTNTVTSQYKVLRDGNKLTLSTTIPINRLDFGVETPEFVAAKIAEDGELNILITMMKD
ncbi:hypothetical protein CMUST_07900 [Corynebacterium mustelae]|uniref:Lipid/polyisoprenoid-binding YceI-like domain-containing protein n=1 Tax=Corynebacterium mustelae TaxID=571915 RepID=A0A0G3GZF0_9CORY|nr:YceI family protein [Corynebacterium mustelae]AKK05905.1 hypothetical protein CMUST_07900 [Corynebacterium mustelae]